MSLSVDGELKRWQRLSDGTVITTIHSQETMMEQKKIDVAEFFPDVAQPEFDEVVAQVNKMGGVVEVRPEGFYARFKKGDAFVGTSTIRVAGVGRLVVESEKFKDDPAEYEPTATEEVAAKIEVADPEPEDEPQPKKGKGK